MPEGGAALAGGVPSFQDDSHSPAGIYHPLLQGEKLAPQNAQFGPVVRVLNAPKGGNIILGGLSFRQDGRIFLHRVSNHF